VEMGMRMKRRGEESEILSEALIFGTGCYVPM
jgi:hypothetical protein